MRGEVDIWTWGEIYVEVSTAEVQVSTAQTVSGPTKNHESSESDSWCLLRLRNHALREPITLQILYSLPLCLLAERLRYDLGGITPYMYHESSNSFNFFLKKGYAAVPCWMNIWR